MLKVFWNLEIESWNLFPLKISPFLLARLNLFIHVTWVYIVQRFSLKNPFLFIGGRDHAGEFLELCREMMNTAKPCFPRDLTQGKLSVRQQFLDPFDALKDKIFFNGDVFPCGEEGRDIFVVIIQHIGKVFREDDVPEGFSA